MNPSRKMWYYKIPLLEMFKI